MSKFDLSVNFSLHNGAVVLESKENFVKIGLTDISNMELRKKLVKSVESFFASNGKKPESDVFCDFISIDDERLRHELSP